MKLICIGNSIVNGFPYDRSDSFPAILADGLNCTVVNKGVNGQSTDQVLERFDRDALSKDPDKVLLLTGANDFMFDINTPAEAMENIAAMLHKTAAAGAEPIAATPLLTDPELAKERWMPELNIDYGKVNEDLQTLSKLIKAHCEKAGIRVIDTQERYADIAEYCDGVHPTQDGYHKLANILTRELRG
ncbi:MAG: SGNH/GDSL hydrolase family protein [Anaerovoracaceae bacterium]|jgi:acyl-CoA thioesterase-1